MRPITTTQTATATANQTQMTTSRIFKTTLSSCRMPFMRHRYDCFCIIEKEDSFLQILWPLVHVLFIVLLFCCLINWVSFFSRTTGRRREQCLDLIDGTNTNTIHFILLQLSIVEHEQRQVFLCQRHLVPPRLPVSHVPISTAGSLRRCVVRLEGTIGTH